MILRTSKSRHFLGEAFCATRIDNGRGESKVVSVNREECTDGGCVEAGLVASLGGRRRSRSQIEVGGARRKRGKDWEGSGYQGAGEPDRAGKTWSQM